MKIGDGKLRYCACCCHLCLCGTKYFERLTSHPQYCIPIEMQYSYSVHQVLVVTGLVVVNAERCSFVCFQLLRRVVYQENVVPDKCKSIRLRCFLSFSLSIYFCLHCCCDNLNFPTKYSKVLRPIGPCLQMAR